MFRKLAAMACLSVCLLCDAGAAAAAPVEPHGDTIVATRHEVRLGTGRLQYTAHAGLVPLYVNDTGERMASVFFVAYFADRRPGQPRRPITFLWNGGPGSNSAQVHFMGFGPKRPQTAETFPDYADNTEAPVVDNAETWLAHSDLVFIDPVGTGFSRATTPEHVQTLYTRRGDAEAVAETIRVLLTRFDAWGAPLLVGGESYGTTRAMLVAEALERRRTRVDGVLLISGGYDAGQQVPEHLRDALAITEFTAIAHYHRRLPADLQALSEQEALAQAAQWARDTYAPALERRDRLSAAEREQVRAGLARFTGIAAGQLDLQGLRLSGADFADRLLSDQGLELGRYDGRMTTRARPQGAMWWPTIDPSLERLGGTMSGTSRVFNRYVRNSLGFESDLYYQGPFGNAFHPQPRVAHPSGMPADWMAARFQMGNRPGEVADSEPPLRRAMTLNPAMQVINMKGRYDGSCALLDEAVARTEADLRRRVTNVCLPGGHMFYTDRAARQLAVRAFAEFVQSVGARP